MKDDEFAYVHKGVLAITKTGIIIHVSVPQFCEEQLVHTTTIKDSLEHLHLNTWSFMAKPVYSVCWQSHCESYFYKAGQAVACLTVLNIQRVSLCTKTTADSYS